MKAALRGSALAHARRPRESSSFGFEGEGGTETGEIRQADHELPGRRERPEIPFFLLPTHRESRLGHRLRLPDLRGGPSGPAAESE
jgi:hypothetical protein